MHGIILELELLVRMIMGVGSSRAWAIEALPPLVAQEVPWLPFKCSGLRMLDAPGGNGLKSDVSEPEFELSKCSGASS